MWYFLILFHSINNFLIFFCPSLHYYIIILFFVMIRPHFHSAAPPVQCSWFYPFITFHVLSNCTFWFCGPINDTAWGLLPVRYLKIEQGNVYTLKLTDIKNETLPEKRWFQFSHCELSIYMQQHSRRKPEYLEKTTDLSQVKVTDKFYYTMLYWVNLAWAGFKLTLVVSI